MIRRIVLAFAMFACLSGGVFVAAGVTAQPASACDSEGGGQPHGS
jgi:hypothetical protein